jgi:hypothetical protein
LNFHFPNSIKLRRALASGILALALLAPFFGGLILFAQNEQCARKMACCKHGTTSGCQRAGHVESTVTGWAGSLACPSGCDQKDGPPSPLKSGPACGRGDAGPAPSVQAARIPKVSSNLRNGAELAVFGRPPPSFLLC